MGISWLLPRVVGFGRATELLMLGKRIDAETAVRYGLSDSVVAVEAIEQELEECVRGLLRVSPWGLAMTKEMLNRSASMDYSSAIEMEAWTQTLLMTTADFSEFRDSFTEKRRPVYRGR